MENCQLLAHFDKVVCLCCIVFVNFWKEGRGGGVRSETSYMYGAGKDIVNRFVTHNHSRYGCPQICLMELRSQIS